MSKTSSRRKITDWVEPSFEDFFGSTSKVSTSGAVKNNESSLGNKSQGKKRTNPFSSLGTCTRTKPNSNQPQDEPWIDKYKPDVQADLAVHKKKVEEIGAWLKAHIEQNPQKQGGSILLLTGPPGCGKTATIQVLAKEMGILIQEWINPIMPEFKREDPLEVFDREFQPYISQSQITLFQDFLLRANKYNKLQMVGESASTDRKIIIIDDMPNQFYRDPTSLHDILRRFRKTGRCPLVFVISDSLSGDSHQRRLLPKEIQEELCVCNISFNPVAPTIMMKVLTRIATTEASGDGGKFAIPDKASLELICSGCAGDIRSAINSLQFSVLRDCSLPSDFWRKNKGKVTKTGKMSSRVKHKKKTEPGELDEDVQAIGGKDASLFLFRALGKILYCKREAVATESVHPKLPAHLSEHNRDFLLVVPEVVVEKSHMRSELFNLYLHQNYLDFFFDVDDVVRASEYLSAADILTGDWSFRSTLNVYSSSIASRGIIHSNSARAFANSQAGVGFKPLHKPQWLMVSKKYEENCLAARNLFSSFCSSPLCLQTQLLPYLAMLSNPLRNQAQISFIQDVGRLPLKRNFGRLEALTDKDPGVADADSGDEDPADLQPGKERDDIPRPRSKSGNGETKTMSSSQGGESDFPASQPQPVASQVLIEDDELNIEEYDSD